MKSKCKTSTTAHEAKRNFQVLRALCTHIYIYILSLGSIEKRRETIKKRAKERKKIHYCRIWEKSEKFSVGNRERSDGEWMEITFTLPLHNLFWGALISFLTTSTANGLHNLFISVARYCERYPFIFALSYKSIAWSVPKSYPQNAKNVNYTINHNTIHHRHAHTHTPQQTFKFYSPNVSTHKRQPSA